MKHFGLSNKMYLLVTCIADKSACGKNATKKDNLKKFTFTHGKKRLWFKTVWELGTNLWF